jgi:hypothetical protein
MDMDIAKRIEQRVVKFYLFLNILPIRRALRKETHPSANLKPSSVELIGKVFLALWFSGQNLDHHFRVPGRKTFNLIYYRSTKFG